MKHILILASLLIACTTDQQPPEQDPPPAVEQRGGGHQCEPCCTYVYKMWVIENGFAVDTPYATDSAWMVAAYSALEYMRSELIENNHGCGLDTMPEIPYPPFMQ